MRFFPQLYDCEFIHSMKKQPAYTDDDVLQFGSAHRGKKLSDVPANYLLWIWNEVDDADERLLNYISNSMGALKMDSPNTIVRRRE